MRLIVPLFALLVAGSAAALAGGDSFSDQEGVYGAPRGTLYDRIRAHYANAGRTVEEEFRDGPCKIERRWERDGDFEERIKCRGPRD